MTTINYEMASLDGLILDPNQGTQRIEGVDSRRVASMVSRWDSSLVGTITIHERADGKRYVPDGAHRVTAAREIGIRELPAMVHRNLTAAEEATLFIGLNTFKQPSAVSRFLARVAEGDEVAGDINRIVKAHGWSIGTTQSNGKITAVTALERVYRTAAGTLPVGAHPDVLDWVLDVLTAAWEHDKESVHQSVLQGLAQLAGRFGPDVDVKKLVSEMSLTRPKVLIGKADSQREAWGGTAPAHLAKVLVGLHNHRRRTNVLPEWVWTR